MIVISKLYSLIDECFYRLLMKTPSVFPVRWRKVVAQYFPDARVRKLYWATLNVFMGEGTYANPGLTVVNNMSDNCKILIGNNVSIAPNVVIVTDSAPNNAKILCNVTYVRDRLILQMPVVVEDEAWLGAGVIILPGVVVGKGAIIGAGSVVVNDIPPFSIAVGAPAKVIRTLTLETSS